MKIPVTYYERINAPFGTYFVDENDKFTGWKYCEKINGQWYFRHDPEE